MTPHSLIQDRRSASSSTTLCLHHISMWSHCHTASLQTAGRKCLPDPHMFTVPLQISIYFERQHARTHTQAVYWTNENILVVNNLLPQKKKTQFSEANSCYVNKEFIFLCHTNVHMRPPLEPVTCYLNTLAT